MNKRMVMPLIIVLLLAAFLPAIASQPTAEPAFTAAPTATSVPFTFETGASFGMTREEVIAADPSPAPYEHSEGLFAYDRSVYGQPATVVYYFEGGQLYQMIAIMQTPYATPGDIMPAFDALDAKLVEKFGAAIRQKYPVWTEGTSPQAGDSAWGSAIADGSLTVTSTWQYGNIAISQILTNSTASAQVLHSILFTVK